MCGNKDVFRLLWFSFATYGVGEAAKHLPIQNQVTLSGIQGDHFRGLDFESFMYKIFAKCPSLSHAVRKQCNNMDLRSLGQASVVYLFLFESSAPREFA